MTEPALPAAHGPLSTAVRRALTGPPSHDHLARIGASVRDSDPYGLDLQLALCMCYELHYRGFAGVDPTWEWNPALLQLRAELERVFLAGVRRDVGPIEPDQTSVAEMEAISVEPVDGTGPSYYLRDTGTWEQMREYFVHRSVYHLKEGDPHAWAIPRLMGTRQSGLRRSRIRRVRRRAGSAPAPAAVRRSVGGGRAGFDVPALHRRSPRRIVGGGEPHVAVRAAPLVAWRRNRALRVDGDHLTAGIPPDGSGAATDGGTVGLHRLLQRARRGRRGARTSRAHRRGRRSRRPGTAARLAMSCSGSARTPRSKTAWRTGLWRRGSRVRRRYGSRWSSCPPGFLGRHLRWLVSHRG